MIIKNNNNLLYKLLNGFRIGITSLLINIFKTGYCRIGLISGFQLQIELNSKYILPFLFFCKNHGLCLFHILTDIICYEFLNTKYRYTLIYNLLNIENCIRLLIKIKIQESNNKLLSITTIFNSANWSEREIFDFYGVYFLFNKDLRRILLDYGFQGYPLRKDFPLSGFIELFYDDTIKKITYEKITLSQEYRQFFYTKNNTFTLKK